MLSAFLGTFLPHDPTVVFGIHSLFAEEPPHAMSNNNPNNAFLAGKSLEGGSSSSSRRQQNRRGNANNGNENDEGGGDGGQRQRLPPMNEVNLMELLAAAANHRNPIPPVNPRPNENEAENAPAANNDEGFVVYGRDQPPPPLFSFNRGNPPQPGLAANDEHRNDGAFLDPHLHRERGGGDEMRNDDNEVDALFRNDLAQFLDQQLDTTLPEEASQRNGGAVDHLGSTSSRRENSRSSRPRRRGQQRFRGEQDRSDEGNNSGLMEHHHYGCSSDEENQ